MFQLSIPEMVNEDEYVILIVITVNVYGAVITMKSLHTSSPGFKRFVR